jgi:hypothetical protein
MQSGETCDHFVVESKEVDLVRFAGARSLFTTNAIAFNPTTDSQSQRLFQHNHFHCE